MDYRFLLVFIFTISTVKCENVTDTVNVTNTKIASVESPLPKAPEAKAEEKPPVPKLPNLCTVCNCTGDIVDCDNRNLTAQFENSQWPNITIKVLSFKGNSLAQVKAFPAMGIRKLVLQKNNISKIEPQTFKQLDNLTELDLSYNMLNAESLQPQVFEGKFSPDNYEPLRKIEILNLAHNVLRSLNQDVFEHMTSLKVLNLSGNLFSNIDSFTSIAINTLTMLEELDMSYCGLKSLPTVQFRSTRYLKKLNLSGNQFTCPPSALKEATTLEILYLDENPMQVVNHLYPFPNMTNLKELSLCCMPHLTIVGTGAFSNLSSLEHLRIQNCPKLESIDEYALALQTKSEGPVWPPLKKLDLSDNGLRYLPKQLVPRWDWLEELDLMNNKWSCDCDNQYLIASLLPQLGKKLMGDKVNTLTCAMPPEHAGKSLVSLSQRKLRCLDINGAQPEKDATILIGVLIGLLLAIPVCLTIFVFWRRGFFFCGSQGPASFSRAFYKRASNDDDF